LTDAFTLLDEEVWAVFEGWFVDWAGCCAVVLCDGCCAVVFCDGCCAVVFCDGCCAVAFEFEGACCA
jgi:hypothetical protein